MPGARKLWNERVQRRVARATRTLGQVKAIKMVGLEKAASKYMQDAREDEIKHGVGVRKWVVTIITAGRCCSSPHSPLYTFYPFFSFFPNFCLSDADLN